MPEADDRAARRRLLEAAGQNRTAPAHVAQHPTDTDQETFVPWTEPAWELVRQYRAAHGARALIVAKEIELLELMEEFPTGDEPRTPDGARTLNAERIEQLRALGSWLNGWTGADLVTAIEEAALDETDPITDEADDEAFARAGFSHYVA